MAAAVGMGAEGMAAAAGTVAVVGMEAAVGTGVVAGMDVAAGDVAGTVDIGGEAVGMAGGPDTAGVVIPTTLTIPIILGVINPGGPFFIVLVVDRFRLIQRARKRCVTRLETEYFRG
jgi:hypothetical protein